MGRAGGSGSVVIEGRTASARGARELEEALTIKRSMPRLLTLGAGLMILAAACGGGASGGTGGPAAFNPDPALVTAAKAEGALNTIALPRDWCNYGEIIDGFSKLYPEIKYNGISPDAGSGDEIQAVKSNPNGGPA